jgi:hypothetical protein
MMSSIFYSLLSGFLLPAQIGKRQIIISFTAYYNQKSR